MKQKSLRTFFKVLSFILASSIFIASAQDSSAKQNLKSTLEGLQSFQADFEQQIVDATGETLQQSEGQIYLQKPNQMRWEVSMPDESLFVADGQVIYNVDHFVEQVTLIDQSAIVDNNPLMLLISDSPEAWDDVEITQNGNDFSVRSTDNNENITNLLLSFPGGILSELTSVDRQEQSNVIVFSNIKQNTAIEASMFAPVFPSTYVIDDQRVDQQNTN